MNLPETMIRLVVRVESADIHPGSFAAQPKTMYRAGTSYCRIDEVPDRGNGIHGSIIVNVPDIWMVNHFDQTARHQDAGAGFVCTMPMFVPTRAELSSGNPLKGLEFGLELAFFKGKGAAMSPGPDIQGMPTRAYTVTIGDSVLSLLTSGSPERPVLLGRKQPASLETYRYGSYDEIPFDATLFARPVGRIEEVK